jgi:TatD DNase family protein
MFIDTHAHIDHKRFDKDRNAILQASKAAGIGCIVNPSMGFETNFTMQQKLNEYDWIYYAVGIHPNSIRTDSNMDKEWEAGLNQLLRTGNKIVAIGETGIDFERVPKNESGELEMGFITIRLQYEWLKRHVILASKYNRPLILHVRNCGDRKDMSKPFYNAHKLVIETLEAYDEEIALDVKGVVHCFVSDKYEDAKAYIDRGYMIGIGGAITYKENAELREIVKKIPLESIVLETDAPYVRPYGLNGNNSPVNIPYIAEVVADIKGIPAEMVEEQTTLNAKKLFRLMEV